MNKFRTVVSAIMKMGLSESKPRSISLATRWAEPFCLP